MTKKFLLVFVFTALILFNSTVSAQPVVDSQSAILIDAQSGQVLYEKNSSQKQYPASITKILTALIVAENLKMDEIVTIGDDVPYSIEKGSSQIYLLPGETLTVEQLLNALLIESANDAAVALAEHISGSTENFAVLMNKRAKELGASHSNFVTPNGLHDENHYTTAHDMAKIMAEVIKHPSLTEIMTRVNYVIPATTKQDKRYLWTKNRLFKSKNTGFYYEGVIGSKTGFTTVARNTLVTAAERDGLHLVTVILQANGTNCYTDTIRLLDFGFKDYTSITLSTKNELIKTIPVRGSETGLKLVAKNNFHYALPKEASQNIDEEVLINDNIQLPVDKGEVLGSIVYSLDGEQIGKVELLAGNSVKNPFNLFTFLKFLILGLLVLTGVLYIAARLYVHSRNKRIRRKKKIRSEYSKF